MSLRSTAARGKQSLLNSINVARVASPRSKYAISHQTSSKAAVHLSSSSSSPSSTRRAYSQAFSEAPPPPPPKSTKRSLPLGLVATFLISSIAGYYFLDSKEPSVLAPDRWTPVTIESIEKLTSDTSLFRIKVPKTVLPKVLSQDQDARPVLSLYVKEPTLQIQRAYTPLSSTCFNPDGSATLELVIKRYPDGEVSRYMHRLGAGDKIEIRAPSITWYYKPKDWDEVVFIAGGTGVTPAFQCINDSLSLPPPSPSPTLSLIYGSPSPSHEFLRPQLDDLYKIGSKKGVFKKVQYHVDQVPSNESLPDNTKVGFIDRKSLEDFMGKKDPEKRRVIVICGPEGMIEAIAGPRGRNFSQGKVGGVLGELGYGENEVVKL
ncbi:cytochrome b5 reductase family protein [Sporobolomyces salmoneus]|uniref:cytochrome b5 reductase family protein n=1 Tax=Sporobolomyces salmoneus TaxID=183962 RepID=UPI003179B012